MPLASPDRKQTSAPEMPEYARKRRQRVRSIAIALALGATVLLFYAVTIIRLGSGVAQRPL
ncbi:MAG: hypothetical protein H7X92_03070 [Chitinophagales bacterium]|nr:hypothetical protein [Hyphomicrobiales bacterium]